MRVRKRIIGLAVAGALIGLAPAAELPVASASSAQVEASCKNATIGGKRKCIARGQYCSRKYQRDYKRYGLLCSKRDRNGRYHLQ